MRPLLPALLLLWSAMLLSAPAAKRVQYLQGGMSQPSAVAVADDGTVFVLDGLKRRILRFDSEGVAQGEISLPAVPGSEPQPATDIAVDGEGLYIADPGTHSIWLLDLQGALQARLQPTVDGQPAEPSAIRPAADRLWWSDRHSHRICRGAATVDAVNHCWGGRGEARGEFQFPYMLAEDDNGYVMAVDVLNGRVQIISPNGEFFGTLGSFGVLPGYLFRPNGIAISSDRRVFVSDVYQGTLSVFQQRKSIGLLLDAQGKPWQFTSPVGIARWRDRLYVVDMGDNSLSVLQLLPDRQRQAGLNSSHAGRDSRKHCLQCHISWSEDYQPRNVSPPLLPVGDQRMCLSCHHGAVIESRHRLSQGHQHPTLQQQREGQPAGDVQRFEHDRVPDEYPLSGDGRLYCASCHTPHDKPEGGAAFREGMHNSWLRSANLRSQLCVACHASRATVKDTSKSRPGNWLNHPVGVSMRPPPDSDAKGFPRRQALQGGVPDQLLKRGARTTADKQLSCQTCHRAHGAEGSPLLVDRAEAGRLCVSCHDSQHSADEKHARRKGIHPVNLELDPPVELGGMTINRLECLSCHAVHDAEPGTPLLRQGVDGESLCKVCHQREYAESAGQAREQGIHPVTVQLESNVELAGREIRELDCRSCHSLHDGVPNTPVLVVDDHDGELCRSCHSEHVGIAGSDHDLTNIADDRHNSLGQPYADAGLCGGCHSMHRADHGAPFLFVGATPDDDTGATSRDRLCLACHQQDNKIDAKPVAEYSHPYLDLVMRSDPATLPLLNDADEVAEFGRIGCITCHDPHQWQADGDQQPASPPERADREPVEGTVLDSFLRSRGIGNGFCVTCHGLDAQVKYKYFHDEQGRQGGVEYLK